MNVHQLRNQGNRLTRGSGQRFKTFRNSETGSGEGTGKGERRSHWSNSEFRNSVVDISYWRFVYRGRTGTIGLYKLVDES